MATEPVQRVPFGLLSFLGIKAGGQNPNALQRELMPVLDVTPNFLAPDLAQEIETTNTIGSAGDEARITIPQGEAWRMISMSMVVAAFSATGGVVYGALGIGDLTGFITAVATMPAPYTVLTTGDLVRLGFAFPSPLVLPPGSVLHSTLMTDLGGGVTANIQCRVLYHRLIV